MKFDVEIHDMVVCYCVIDRRFDTEQSLLATLEEYIINSLSQIETKMWKIKV